MVMFPLQPAMAQRDDVGARHFLPRQQPGQENIEGGNRVMDNAAGESQDWDLL